MLKKIFITIGVIAVVAIGVFVWLNKADTKQKDTVKIGAILPLTGSMANYGISLKQGIDLAVSEINDSGGIIGTQLVVMYEDSKSDAKTGINAFNKLATMNNVPVVFGSLTSVILAIQPIADEKQVVLINSSAISPNIRDKADDFLFSIMVNGATEAQFMAKEFQAKYPNEKIAILYGNNSSGVYIKDQLISELQLLGNTNVHVESYELNTTNFKVQLDKIKNSQTKHAYFIPFSNNEIGDVLRQAKELNCNVQWFANSGIETKETLELAKDAANGIIYSYPSYLDDLYSNFQKNYYSKYNVRGDLVAAISYDGVYLIANAMKKFGFTSIDIQKGLRSADGYNGIFGNIDFSKRKKQYLEKELFWKKIENNQYIILE